MTLKEYLARCTTPERNDLWEGSRSLRTQIYAYANGRKPSLERAAWIEQKTGGKVTRQELRPDLVEWLLPSAVK
jgi:hypothetical protein